MRVAALDLGSNTFLLLIADMEGNRIERVILDQTQVTRLGQGVHQARAFHPEALQRADACLAEYAKLIKEAKVERVIAVATSAARDVTNRSAFLGIGERYNIPIQIISGEREAAITYAGAVADLELTGSIGVIDVGGGSTEVIATSAGSPKGVSIDIGSVRLTELFLSTHPCLMQEIEALEKYVRAKISEVKGELPKGCKSVVAVAGTPTTLAALQSGREFSEVLVHRSELEVGQIWQWRNRMMKQSVAERQALPGMQANRADVIVAGATILALVSEAIGASKVIVSTKGVRYGVASLWQEF